ncbi:hypothetical protein MMC25_002753 [Agyrium rufum]|nr:hypothetical protein [Agyrium rufum]
MTSKPAFQDKTTKVRFLLLSDTHSQPAFPPTDSSHAYRHPFPDHDVLLHAGDISDEGQIWEYKALFRTLAASKAELKINFVRDPELEDVLSEVRDIWTGQKAKRNGIVYLEEGVREFRLKGGAKFTCTHVHVDRYSDPKSCPQVYASPYTPEFYNMAFPYPRSQDRFNPPSAETMTNASSQNSFQPPNPIPSWPVIDIVMTHGPPMNVMDTTVRGQNVGCEALAKALPRVRPRLHVFGHIHEGWGAPNLEKVRRDRAVMVDLTRDEVQEEWGEEVGVGGKLVFGKETLSVNAAIMNFRGQPVNAPWVVDLELPVDDVGS